MDKLKLQVEVVVLLTQLQLFAPKQLINGVITKAQDVEKGTT